MKQKEMNMPYEDENDNENYHRNDLFPLSFSCNLKINFIYVECE